MEENTSMNLGNPMEPQKILESPKSSKFKMDKNTIVIGIAVLAILVTAGMVVMNLGSNNVLSWLNLSFMSKDAVAKNAVDYLNKNILQQGQTATLESSSKESGVIKLKLKIGGNSYDSYVTSDGKLFFPQAYSISGTQQGGQSGQADVSQVATVGRPYVGNENAPVVMAYWFDYQCPFCKKNHQQVIDRLLEEYVQTGKLKIVFKQYAFLGADSTTAALAEKAVWEAAPAKFWVWHDAMFVKQDAENGGWGSKADILAMTASLGIDSVKVGKLMDSKADQYQKEISDDKADGTKFGIDGTPGAIIGTELISGAQPYETFKAAVDKMLNKK